MVYRIKENFWSWGDDFYIFDEDGREMFFVDGEAFSWGDKLSFQDMDGNELLFWKAPPGKSTSPSAMMLENLSGELQ